MRDLTLPQTNWDEIEAFETELDRAMTVQEKIRDYCELMLEFGDWPDPIEAEYQAEREAALMAIQERLASLEQYRRGKDYVQPQLDRLTRSAINLQARFAARGIASAVLGGLAYAAWARPRVTKEADLKIDLSRDDAESLWVALGDVYRSLHAEPVRALRRNGIVFVQDEAGSRIDLMLADTEFDRKAIQRAKPIDILPGLSANMVSAEDLIIYKMISTRTQDVADVEQIVRVQGNALDDAYVTQTLRDLEHVLDDSTLVATYEKLRKRHSR